MLIQFDPEILLQGMYAINELTKAYQNHNTQTHTHTHRPVSCNTGYSRKEEKGKTGNGQRTNQYKSVYSIFI